MKSKYIISLILIFVFFLNGSASEKIDVLEKSNSEDKIEIRCDTEFRDVYSMMLRLQYDKDTDMEKIINEIEERYQRPIQHIKILSGDDTFFFEVDIKNKEEWKKFLVTKLKELQKYPNHEYVKIIVSLAQKIKYL